MASKDINAAKRALLIIREAFIPLQHAPMIGRPVEDHDGLRTLVIDFGASGYLALFFSLDTGRLMGGPFNV